MCDGLAADFVKNAVKNTRKVDAFLSKAVDDIGQLYYNNVY
jgi:hypothetical protein